MKGFTGHYGWVTLAVMTSFSTNVINAIDCSDKINKF